MGIIASTARRCGRLLIAGPTASGKSALALALAERLGGVIINADSMQVYRDLRVITARPSFDEEAHAPHLLYGHVDAAENYSVGRWIVDARAVLAEAVPAGSLPIMVGGTGLYFKALTEGLTAIPPIPPEIRSRLRARLEAEGSQALHGELGRRDSAAAGKIQPSDRTRIVRALEVLAATGRTLADWHRDGMSPVIDGGRTVKVFLEPERETLFRRIDERFEAMLVAGALEEVRALAGRGLDPRLPAMKAHGVPWLIRHLAGEMTLGEAAAEAKRDTRRYTRRQLTWFRHQLPDWAWVAPEAAMGAVLRALGA